ncbi:MAG: ABC transporter permease [Chitinispirillales bacterium]|jgi:phospholipid/cholesterol/gamma-HCH transport system permease protein|nr:ABC transporter permease [Chitinispirillales bacterium]
MIAPLRFIAFVGSFARGWAGKGRAFVLGTRHYTQLAVQTTARVPLIVKNLDITTKHMYTLGIESIPLVTMIALFLGSATVTQAVYQMSGMIPLRYLGALVCKTTVTELGPVITSMVFAGRVATGIAAEIASMKGSEQLDAMNVLRLDPIRYLIVPKMVACVVMLPVLTIWAILMAFVGSAITVAISVDVTMYTYLDGMRLFFNPWDVYMGVGKTTVFGAIVAITGAYFGLTAKGGAEGVGNATTKAVVVSAVLILIFDFIVAVMVM